MDVDMSFIQSHHVVIKKLTSLVDCAVQTVPLSPGKVRNIAWYYLDRENAFPTTPTNRRHITV